MSDYDDWLFAYFLLLDLNFIFHRFFTFWITLKTKNVYATTFLFFIFFLKRLTGRDKEFACRYNTEHLGVDCPSPASVHGPFSSSSAFERIKSFHRTARETSAVWSRPVLRRQERCRKNVLCRHINTPDKTNVCINPVCRGGGGKRFFAHGPEK